MEVPKVCHLSDGDVELAIRQFTVFTFFDHLYRAGVAGHWRAFGVVDLIDVRAFSSDADQRLVLCAESKGCINGGFCLFSSMSFMS